MLPKQFTGIYYAFDKFNRLNLIFENSNENYSLYFDGQDFYFRRFQTNVTLDYSVLKHSINKDLNGCIQVDSISQSEDEVNFIVFSDGTIFQLYFMIDDERSYQRLAEFSKNNENLQSLTPLGITDYDAAVKRFQSGEKCVIKTDSKS